MAGNIIVTGDESWGNPPVDAPKTFQNISGASGLGTPYENVAVPTSVNSSTASQLVCASNGNRNGVMFYNDSSTNCFISFLATASTSVYTVKLTTQMGWFLPGSGFQVYTGVISAVWDSANGALKVTEW